MREQKTTELLRAKTAAKQTLKLAINITEAITQYKMEHQKR